MPINGSWKSARLFLLAMASLTLSMIESIVLLAAALAVGAGIGAAVERYRSRKRRRDWRERNPSRWQKGHTDSRVTKGPWATGTTEPVILKTPDTADQLRIVMGASFAIQPLLNRSEARVFKELDQAVLGCNPGWQVMAQVSLGEILRSRDADAYRCINSKRVDLLLVDEDCRPRHAIEYQGGAHHQGSAAARDAVKKEALRRAGIGYHEVVSGQTTPSDLRRLVERLVDRPETVE